MKRCVIFILAVVFSFQFAATAVAQDDDFEVTGHYRFLPRVSRLVEIDPVWDPPAPWIVFGEFDFVHYRPDPRAFLPATQIANVDAWASHPMLAISEQLDDVVNLSELIGGQINSYQGQPFELFHFEGDDGIGYPTDLFAARSGRWLYLRGENHPVSAPTTHGPFRSKWILRGLARQTPFPDFDNSEAVDSGDLNNWFSGFGEVNRPAQVAQSLGDADGDRDVDGADFLSWQRDVGETPPDVAMFDAAIDAARASAATAVPEPSAGALIAFGMTALALRRRAAEFRCPVTLNGWSAR
jgi:hypothetical protein